MIQILQLFLPPVFNPPPPPSHWGNTIEMLNPLINIIEAETTLMTMTSPITSERLHTIRVSMNPPTYMRIRAWGRILPGRCTHIPSSLLLYPRLITATLLTSARTSRLVDPTDATDTNSMRGSKRCSILHTRLIPILSVLVLLIFHLWWTLMSCWRIDTSELSLTWFSYLSRVFYPPIRYIPLVTSMTKKHANLVGNRDWLPQTAGKSVCLSVME